MSSLKGWIGLVGWLLALPLVFTMCWVHVKCIQYCTGIAEVMGSNFPLKPQDFWGASFVTA